MTEPSLTGPMRRGDLEEVARHLAGKYPTSELRVTRASVPADSEAPFTGADLRELRQYPFWYDGDEGEQVHWRSNGTP